ncbi:MAG: DEAD/DEAH box helicase [Deltaproteobacteria bacterium]
MAHVEPRKTDPSDRDPPKRKKPSWKSALARLGSRGPATDSDAVRDALVEKAPSEIIYLLNLRETRLRDQLVVDFYEREGADAPLKPLELDERAVFSLEHPEDRDVLSLLLGNSAEGKSYARLDPRARYSRSVVRPGMFDLVLPRLCRTGRFSVEGGMPNVHPTAPLTYDPGEPFTVTLSVTQASEDSWALWGALVRDDERLDINEPRLVLSSGLFVHEDRIQAIDAGEAIDWVFRLRRHGEVRVPMEARDEFLVELAAMPNLPEIELPPELHWSKAKVKPRPRVVFAPQEDPTVTKYVIGRVGFDYGGAVIDASSRCRVVADENGRQLFSRDKRAERTFLSRLAMAGVKATDGEERARGEVKIPAKHLSRVIRELVDEDWHIEADGQAIRANGVLRTKVSSGIDWFDLEGVLDYGDATASLPELLLCATRGESYVTLSDGSRGVVPDWMTRYAAFAQTGKQVGLKLRFSPSQAGIIDALMTGHDDASVDVKYARLKKLFDKAKTETVEEPTGFVGKLRPYQREGLAWLTFLETSQYGGCLADDMGLGKTVQVLAMLQGRHRPGGEMPRQHRPSLIVVPRSLLFNWQREAEKFAPELKVVEYTGARRDKVREALEDYDLIVTTYGTLRQDILHFLDLQFNTIVLDEAQAIKNPRSQSAKACRLVRADHRLAISGTPIENSLEELWSIFEFLNPGMLGTLDEFSAHERDKDEEWLDLLSRSLKPFMLRRTKEQVLKDLPEKTEKTLYVDLGEAERDKYDELRTFYRNTLTSRIDEVGLAKAKIHVLEALLRLRQAACHPGLIDKTRMAEDSAKLASLFTMIDHVVQNGHKALVFSQFTTLLQIVRMRLEREGIKHSYLDGATRDRGGACEAFQNDPTQKVFLISLKAGGCGLNLTSSDYVFILDPWWNPAAEAQAIDRAHRMGQTRPVFAYRLITRDTVEEKIEHLQNEKRKLADAIITGDRKLMRELTVEDLDKLFE